MSLFGTSPDESSDAPINSKLRNTLFDDSDTAAPPRSTSLFADDDDSGPSPWAMPPAKKGRAELIKSLLPASAVPDSYIDLYDHVLKDGDSHGGKLSSAAVNKVISAGRLGTDDEQKIMTILAHGGQMSSLDRNEFNVLLALIGLAQEKEDITLDSVDERRRNLPVPKLPSLFTSSTTLGASASNAPPGQQTIPPSKSQTIASKKPTNTQKTTMEEDPWGSPAMHEGHNHSVTNGSSSSNGVRAPVRTTSNFTTDSFDDSLNDNSKNASNGSNGSNGANGAAPPTDSTGLWGSYDDAPTSGYTPRASNITGIGPDIGEDLESGGFGGATEADGLIHPTPTRALGGGRTVSGSVEEIVQITLLPEKEGMFMFQHHNYQITSARRGSQVVRRYSDFVWLLDCLQKRYPFRQLPLLPPKRMGVNGNHIAADKTFIEKRRRGLVRFTNALTRHPVLSQEQLVVMFLTVPTELSVWRKQATISVQEEFVGKSLPAGLEDSLPSTLDDLFNTTRAGVRRSTEIYINLCNLMDRLSKRTEGLAADHLRLSLGLDTLREMSETTYASDTNDVPLLNDGLQATSKHLAQQQALLEDEAKAWDEGVLEDLKRQRDALVSVRDMFDRKDRFDKDNIPQLERRIANNESKLSTLRNKPEGQVKPGEIEKVTESIIKDKESIVAQHARGVLVRECIRNELLFFQQSQYHVSRWNQDWAQERVKYSELASDNWRQLHDQLESMPLGD